MTQELEQGDSMQSPVNPEEAPINPENKKDIQHNGEESILGGIDEPLAGANIEGAQQVISVEGVSHNHEQEGSENIINSESLEGGIKVVEMEAEKQTVTEHLSDGNEVVDLQNEITNDTDEHAIIEPVENYLVYTKEELISLLEELYRDHDYSSVRNKVAAIKEAFQTILSHEKNTSLAVETEEGNEKEDQVKTEDPLSDKFFGLMKKFNRKRIELREKLDQEKIDNLKAKTDILMQFKNLIQYEENMQKAFNQFHDLQAKWRSIGPTPQQNVNDLWLTYKLYVDKFYELIRINKELQELDFKKNLAAKIKICERAEELILEPSINKALNHMQSLQNQFRETGPVPRDNKNEVWERFKAASDKVFERKHQYLEEQKEKYDKSLAEKNALCEKADELSKGIYTKSNEWQEKIKEFLQLQADWKKTGFAGKEAGDKIWLRFKASFDHFFQNKKEFYNKAKEEFNSHLQKKTELCLHAEALQDSTDWKNTTNELKKLQQDWKMIGSAGEYQERKIFNRFRKACDHFFENKNKHFATQDQQQEENYLKKVELIQQIETFTPGENHFNSIESLKEFQRHWMDIGMVPLSKKEEINNRYKKAIDEQFSNLRIDDGERNRMRYTQKTDAYKSKPGGGKEKMDDEKRFLLGKISALKNDVSLWENNIGFFAKSKNADVLKMEFEEKINKAKEEIKSLNEKIELIKKA